MNYDFKVEEPANILFMDKGQKTNRRPPKTDSYHFENNFETTEGVVH
jgi:hypothetical protein